MLIHSPVDLVGDVIKLVNMIEKSVLRGIWNWTETLQIFRLNPTLISIHYWVYPTYNSVSCANVHYMNFDEMNKPTVCDRWKHWIWSHFANALILSWAVQHQVQRLFNLVLNLSLTRQKKTFPISIQICIAQYQDKIRTIRNQGEICIPYNMLLLMQHLSLFRSWMYVANLQNVLYNFWKERLLLRSFQYHFYQT